MTAQRNDPPSYSLPKEISYSDLLRPWPIPEAPNGWKPGPPDFVGVGTMRSGTSWWWTIMISHPDFALLNPRNKELHFFDHHMKVEQIDPVAYHRYFPRAKGMITGEWTPRYIFDYWTIPMLRQVAPDTKILVLLRDPLQRFQSALAFSEKMGFPVSHVTLHEHFSRSLYSRQLNDVLAYFPSSQVLVQQYEQCAIDTTAQMKRTMEFVGLDPAKWQLPDSAKIPINTTEPTASSILTPATREAIARTFREDASSIFKLFPSLDPELWPTMAC